MLVPDINWEKIMQRLAGGGGVPLEVDNGFLGFLSSLLPKT